MSAAKPRVRRVLETALDCDDLARSAAFYTTLLAVTPMVAMDRLVAIDAGEGTVLLLFQKGAASSVDMPGGLVPAHESGGPGHLAFADRPAELPGLGGAARRAWHRRSRAASHGNAAASASTSAIPTIACVELATPGLWPCY